MLLVVIGAILMVLATKSLTRTAAEKRALRLPGGAAARIDDAPNRACVLTGKIAAAADALQRAPITGREALWWRAVADQQETDSRYATAPDRLGRRIPAPLFHVMREADAVVPFVLHDGSNATATVRGNVRVIGCARERIARTGQSSVPILGPIVDAVAVTQSIQKFLQENHASAYDRQGDERTVEVFEEVLVVGDRVRVYGFVERSDGDAYRGTPHFEVSARDVDDLVVERLDELGRGVEQPSYGVVAPAALLGGAAAFLGGLWQLLAHL